VAARGRRRAWLIAASLAAVVLVAGATVYFLRLAAAPPSSSSSAETSETVILPSMGTPSGCITGTPGVPRPVLNLSNGVLQGNTYDVPNGTVGHVGMCYSSDTGSMLGYANWSHVGGEGYAWMSYPQITYGVNFWYGPYSTFTGQNPEWSLPTTVGSVVQDDVWFTTEYSLHAPPARDVDGYDLSLDDFFTESWPSYFEVGPFVEVEMFLAHNISYPFEWVHWSTPTLINGTLVSEPWDVAWWCHGPGNSSNANVSFDLSLGGQETQGLASASIGVNLSAVLGEVERLMPSVTCWTGPTSGFPAFHLDEANLGSEDGARAGSSFNYNWTVDQYCIHNNVGGPSPSGLSCASDPAPRTGSSESRGPITSTEWSAVPVTRGFLR